MELGLWVLNNYRQKDIGFKITVDRDYNRRNLGVHNVIIQIFVWGCNFERMRTDSTILNLISKRIYGGIAYEDSVNNKIIKNPTKPWKF